MNTTSENQPNLDPADGFAPAGQSSIAKAAKELRDAASGKIHDVVHDAEGKVRDAMHSTEAKVRSALHNAGEKAEELKHTASVQAKQLRENATEQWDDTCVRARELQITAEDYIRQNPSKCVLGALGLGFLIGLLVRR